MICMGPATRSGCGSRCTRAAMPCRGCYGPPPGVVDQGAKMLSTLASIIDAESPEKIAEIASTVLDPLGTFYRFGLAGSLLRRAKV
jgi:F420-non-reducing hydrogenase small subunit